MNAPAPDLGMIYQTLVRVFAFDYAAERFKPCFEWNYFKDVVPFPLPTESTVDPREDCIQEGGGDEIDIVKNTMPPLKSREAVFGTL